MRAVCYRFAWLGLLLVTTGCAMCDVCDERSYTAYGGAWDRIDRCYGRVGSAFTPEVGMKVRGETSAKPEVTKPVEQQPLEQQPLEQQPLEQKPVEQSPRVDPSPFDELPPKPPAESENKSTDASVLLGPIRTTF